MDEAEWPADLAAVKALFSEFICNAFGMESTLARLAVTVSLDVVLIVFDAFDQEKTMGIHVLKGMGTGVLRGPVGGDGIHVGEEMSLGF